MKILFAIDSLKGCLTSAEANAAAEQGALSACPECETICLPIADGGEGMLDAMLATVGGRKVECITFDPLCMPISTHYGISPDGKTAYIEMASASGLTLVPPESRNPLHTTSYGTGCQIADALSRGCRRFVIGLGGSATCDAGLGMLQPLGFRFYDKEGERMYAPITGKDLEQIDRIEDCYMMPELRSSGFVAACDVRNPFFGPYGAAHVFAPQKGASPADVLRLDAGLEQVVDPIINCTGRDISRVPGAGAAGGMGGGMAGLLASELRSGIELLLDTMKFDEYLRGVDVVVTGEGHADKQTLMGKVPLGIMERARAHGIPTLLLAGRVSDKSLLLDAGFGGVFCFNPPGLPLEQALLPSTARQNLADTVRSLVAGYISED